MELETKLQARKDFYMQGMEVTLKDSTVNVAEGSFYYEGTNHDLEPVDFEIDSSVQQTYDLYITRSPHGIEYDLIATPIEDIAFYNGGNALIHNYVTIRTDTMEGTVNRIQNDRTTRISLNDPIIKAEPKGAL